MNIDICKLTPDLAEEYARFFDTTPHDDGNTKCYCVTWCGDNVYNNGGSHWYALTDERRAHAIQRVKNADIQGYLAYCDGKVIGWCNANTKAACQIGMDYLRSQGGVPLEKCREGEKIKFIFCFTIAPEMQRMGVATKMLQYICQDAAADGFDHVEAYTNKTFAVHDFRGPLDMYEKCGFIKIAEKDGKVVVRKPLK